MKVHHVSLLLLALLALRMESSSGHLKKQRTSEVTLHWDRQNDEEQVTFQTPPPPPRNAPHGTPKPGECPRTSPARGDQVSSYCTEDTSCEGDRKCCPVGNIKSCVLPVGVHLGYCPTIEEKAVTSKHCSEDRGCAMNEKCCMRNGHKACTRAVPGTPGFCPKRRVQEAFGPCENECRDDRCCSPGQKCCFSGCGLRCVAPEIQHSGQQREPGEEDQRPGKGQVPSGGPCHFPPDKGPCSEYEPRFFYNSASGKCEEFIYGGCQGNDNNFETHKECYQACFSPVKPGRCPPPDQSNDSMPGLSCVTDHTCPGNERCCPTTCGQQCKLPLEINRGYCPKEQLSRLDDATHYVGRLAGCFSDARCNKEGTVPLKKCCIRGCIQVCLEAVEEHPGMCPQRRVVPTFSPCNNTCNDDTDCPHIQKCCFTGCSLGCLDPVHSDRCQQPPETGSCDQVLHRYFYSAFQKKCVTFVYSGCGGNSNNFKTKGECEKSCGKVRPEQSAEE